MDKTLQIEHSILIKSTKEKVWEVMTNPKKIEVYLFGTQVKTDWAIGSQISFSGSYDGQSYEDKGLVMANIPHQLLAYDYWSGFSGLEDLPENYSEVSYHIKEVEDGMIKFTWQQIGFSSKEGAEHTSNGLPAMLEQIKSLAES